MTKSTSLFARSLREYRATNGQHGRMTQEELAELLGISVDAVGKYERSVSFIRGDLEHRLSEKLGWSRKQVMSCREDWDTQHLGSRQSAYSLLDDASVEENFNGSWRDASIASIKMAQSELPGLPPEFAANEDVFLPIYETYRDNWAAVMFQGKMVAKWSLPFLLPEDVDLFRAGLFLESQMSVDRLHRSIFPGQYYGYCPALIVCSGHEKCSSLLISSFVQFLEKLAKRDVLLYGIGTVSVSPGGAQICRELGMTKIGNHCLDPEFTIWELPGTAISDSIFGRRSSLLRTCYAKASS